MTLPKHEIGPPHDTATCLAALALDVDAGGDENTHLLEFDATTEALALRDLTPFADARSMRHAQLDDSPDLHTDLIDALDALARQGTADP